MHLLWYILAISIFCEALITLISIFGFRRFFIARTKGDESPVPWPKAAVLAPCKGTDASLEANIATWTAQNYPDYTIFFIVESEEDPAVEAIRSAGIGKILVAGKATDCGQKIHNLRFGIQHLPPEYETLAFIDSDARVRTDWLRALVGCVQQNPADAASGYRWFQPGIAGAGNLLRMAWNASVLTLYEASGIRNFAWGGSMAIHRRTFDDAQVLRFWEGSLSDDYALTNAMRASGRLVHFVPRAIALTHDSVTLGEFFAWAGRQLLITRVYFPHLWRMAFSFHVLWMAWIIAGLFIEPIPFLVSFLGVQVMQGWKGSIRLDCVRKVWPELHDSAVPFWMMSPFVGVANFLLLTGNLLTRRVKWRGIEYEVLGKNELRVVKDSASLPRDQPVGGG